LNFGGRQLLRAWTLRMLYLCLLAAVACTPARRDAQNWMVRKVHIEGNGDLFSGDSDAVLRQHLAQESSGLFPLTWPLMYVAKAAELDVGNLHLDAYRLEVWYAHHGWFDARVTGWQTRRVRAKGERRAGVVDVYAHVEPGPMSMVGDVRLEGMSLATEILGRSVLRSQWVQRGEPYSLESVRLAEQGLAYTLHDHGYPYAAVTSRSVVRTEDLEVDVRFDVKQGVSATVGEITLTNSPRVPARFVEQHLTFATGDAYKQSKMLRTQRALFDLGVFSLVSVQPDLTDPSREEVPVEVRLTEGRFQRVRFGVGAEYDIQQVQPAISIGHTHANLFGRLVQLDSRASLGLAIDVVTPSQAAPDLTYLAATGLKIPWVGHPRLDLDASGGIEQDVQQSLFVYRRPYADLSALWKSDGSGENGGEWKLRFGPHIEGFRYLEESLVLSRVAEAINGTGFVNPYLLLAIDQTLSYDARDDKTLPTRGSFASASVRTAIPVGDARYRFVSTTGELRRYTKIRLRQGGRVTFPLVGAGKIRAHWVQPLGDSSVPYAERAFMGGSTSLRGFMTHQVGPYRAVCYDPQDLKASAADPDPCVDYLSGEIDKTIVPQGGLFAVEASAELRYDWAYGIRWALFSDVGLLSESVSTVSLEDVRWDVGVGMRYDTAIGPLRMDVAVRPRFQYDTQPGGERRVYDTVSGVNELFRRRGWLAEPDGEVQAPLALVFFLAIGESV